MLAELLDVALEPQLLARVGWIDSTSKEARGYWVKRNPTDSWRVDGGQQKIVKKLGWIFKISKPCPHKSDLHESENLDMQ